MEKHLPRQFFSGMSDVGQQPVLQPGQIKFVFQACLGGDNHHTVILQKTQDAVQRCGIVAQPVKTLHHNSVDTALPHSFKYRKQRRAPKAEAG